ncbi:sigma 54-interacting transcriptional regulator, partial [Desulfobacula sp.]
KDLKKEIQIGNFREDLFDRINVFEINIEFL